MIDFIVDNLQNSMKQSYTDYEKKKIIDICTIRVVFYFVN